ncbi:MAG: TonB-dependent receptor [Prolixibacteraceae bacterium]|nr:TonB-dependent receptor [Prolixibacteraceae bacterium]
MMDQYKRAQLKRFSLIILIMLYLSVSAYAQLTITGIVTDANDNSPLVGVTVVIKGSTIGTVTNLDGAYQIRANNNNDVLVFSYIGYTSTEVPIGNENVINVVLKANAIDIDDVVVIGYGTVQKEDLTGSVAVVSAKDLTRTPAATFTQALQGRASGVMVSNTGSPGSDAQIRIRGIGSINMNPNPIYVIDGVITGSLSSVSPSDIETMQVLKDASSAAIYGADGANGVIIVTTKRGKSGTPKVNYSAYVTLSRVPHQFDMMNADEYVNFYSNLYEEAGQLVNDAYKSDFRQWYYGDGWQQGTNWQDEVTQQGFGHNHNLNVSGGGQGSNYSFSMNYYDEKGIQLNSAAERINIRINSDSELGQYVKIGESVAITRSQNQTPHTHQGNPWQVSLIASPLMRVYNENNKEGFEGPQVPFEFVNSAGETVTVLNTGGNDKPNPRGPMEIGDNRSYSTNVLTNVYLEIKPFSGLTFKTTPSMDFTSGRRKVWVPAFDLGVRSVGQASLTENYWENVTLGLENQLTFSKEFGAHQVNVTAVHQVRKYEGHSIEGTADGFPYEKLNELVMAYEEGRRVNGYYSPFRSESYLGRLIYDYAGKYFLTASLRRDGNSRFGELNRWGTFPSASVAWRIDKDFLEGVESISMLKARVGYGQTGNSNIGNFQYESLIDPFTNFSPVIGGVVVPALNVIHSFGNPSIKWEAASMLNIGFDLNMLDNKIEINAEYYIKNQNDLLVKRTVSSAFGRVQPAGAPWVNLGDIQNRGFDFTGSFRDKQGDFSYAVTANLTTVKNEVKYLPVEDITSGNNRTAVGHAIGSFYGYIAERIVTPDDFDAEGIYLFAKPLTGFPVPGDLMFKDLNKDGVVSDLDRTFIGKAIPDFTYSLNIELTYKGFDLSAFFYGMQNYQIYNHLRAGIEGFSSQDLDHNKLRDYGLNYYRDDRPSEKYVRADLNNKNQNDRISSWYLEDASFFRLKDLQIGYTLPSSAIKLLGLSYTRMYASFTNLLTVSSYTGRDPEAPSVGDPVSPGNDWGSYPVPRAVNIGLQIHF